MSKHTSERWQCDGNFVYAIGEDGTNVFTLLVQRVTCSTDELLANARLIAAAPALLEACEEALSHFAGVTDLTSGEDALIGELGAAIAIAKGESS